MSSSDTLGYDVFVLDPAPQGFAEPLPNGEPRVWQPIAVTLIYGERDAVLVDPPMTDAQTAEIGDWIALSGKNLTHILVSHGHGDHWHGADALARRFDAQVVATESVIAEMNINLGYFDVYWDKILPGQITRPAVTAVTVPGNRITLEGHEVRLVEVGHTDGDNSSVIHVPDLGLVVAGDALYNGAHMSISFSYDGGRDAWRKALDTVEALNPRRIVASHKDKDRDDDATRVLAASRGYLDAAEEALEKYGTATEFFHGMIERFPDYKYGQSILWVGAKALYNIREQATNGGAANPGEIAFVAWVTP